ncbi:DUF4214 domain-containing protein [Brevundimonas sp.]|uniref:DUF4214 domain-containing protein n=1 Tax=Brevundimonas sp. TaxID=1871086 RepID=UPI00286C1917|nr:DUF4214 domain-containing protein [Brevundimonas sp.]
MTPALAFQGLNSFPGMTRTFGAEGASTFGDVGGYAPCGCCGGFHAIFEEEVGPLALLNSDDRGGFGPNGRVSLTTAGAAQTLTRSNLSWATGLGQATNVNFAFRSTAPSTMPSETTGFTRFTDAQITATLLALASWSEVANITFTRVNDGDGFSDAATMLFGNYSSGSEGAAAFAFLPSNRADSSNSGDVWINNSLSYNATPLLLGYGQQVLTHEIGHAIGLSHPAAYNATAGQSLTYAANAGYFEDSRQYSVMSYFSETNTGASFGSGRYSAAPLMDDIAAVQRLYGANMTTRTGNNTYGFNSNAGQAWFSATSTTSILIFAVWDAGGTDTFDFSGYSNAQVIDLRQGSFSNVGALIGNVSIALGAVIENAVGGAGADTIFGSAGDNVLTGGAGNDRIDGGLGSDTVVFSGNRAQYTITWNGQTANVVGPDGSDVISNVEFLRFADQTIAAAFTGGLNVSGDITTNAMTGSGFGDFLYGLGGNDTLNGLGGADYLDGGSGNDAISGGDGDDVLIGGDGDDVLDGGAGFDHAYYAGATAAVSVSLLTNRATGGAGNDTLVSITHITGSRFSDTLVGDNEVNSIAGGGGADVIFGGGGNDILQAGDGALTGGAPDIIKAATTANASIATAISMDPGFDLLPQDDIASSATIPHATVRATAHAGIEYYGFTANAGGRITLDIDNASFDSTLRLFNAAGVELASNDDSNPDGGPATDSQITFTVPATGVYYVAVGQWDANSGSTFTSKAITAGGTYTLHVSVTDHGVTPLTLTGSRLIGEAGDDQLLGGGAGDYLNGGTGNDILNGNGGVDTAAYGGGRRQYVANSASVSGNGEGTDTLVNVENASFVDGVLTFDVNSQAAQVMRLYDAAFDRTFDQGGFEANLNVLEAGISLTALAGTFLNSAEFQQRYGALSNQAFVEQLYRFCLNREGDAAGVQTWVGALNAGASRTDILVQFSESQEHRNLTMATLNAGLWVADDQALVIARLYDATFDRLPDVGGLNTWTNQLKAGAPLFSIAAAFAGSAEFQARYGALSNQAFVEQMYRFCLNREGDAGGVQVWVNALNGGATRAQILATFSESAEHVSLTAALWLGGVRFEGVASPLMDVDKGADAVLMDDGFLSLEADGPWASRHEDWTAPQTLVAAHSSDIIHGGGPEFTPTEAGVDDHYLQWTYDHRIAAGHVDWVA